LRKRRLGAVDRVEGGLDVHPVGGEAEPVELDGTPKLREQWREPAVVPVGPERFDHLGAREGTQAVQRQERGEKPPLPARQLALHAPTADRDREPAAELDSRALQPDANIVPTAGAYNAPVEKKGVGMSKQISCECGKIIRGDSDDEVVARAEEHIASDHPDLIGKVTRTDLVGWIEEV
jgi:predicted small metal-binding protein